MNQSTDQGPPDESLASAPTAEAPSPASRPSHDSPLSHFERLGGRDGLTRIIDIFIDRVTADMMIGFFFRQIDKDKLKELEYGFAATHLGGPSEYAGRPLRVAHANHRIMGGQFNRRLRILDQTLHDLGVDEDIAKAWLQHNEALRSHITRDSALECIGDGPPLPDAAASTESSQK